MYGTEKMRDIQKEADAILDVLVQEFPKKIYGKTCIKEMRKADYPHWKQDEWGGWYFEFKGVPALVDKLGGSPMQVLNTTFDYSLSTVWDFKLHSAGDGRVILNSMAATDEIIDDIGFGFIVMTAIPEFDDGEFKKWQREYRESYGHVPRKRTRPRKYDRKAKKAYKLIKLDAFYIPGSIHLGHEAFGVLSQGKQGDGAYRKPKYLAYVDKAYDTIYHLGQRDIGA